MNIHYCMKIWLQDNIWELLRNMCKFQLNFIGIRSRMWQNKLIEFLLSRNVHISSTLILRKNSILVKLNQSVCVSRSSINHWLYIYFYVIPFKWREKRFTGEHLKSSDHRNSLLLLSHSLKLHNSISNDLTNKVVYY